MTGKLETQMPRPIKKTTVIKRVLHYNKLCTMFCAEQYRIPEVMKYQQSKLESTHVHILQTQ